ncbi:hypothetical protein ACFLZ8_00635 [Planctomycetota bacterium]
MQAKEVMLQYLAFPASPGSDSLELVSKNECRSESGFDLHRDEWFGP